MNLMKIKFFFETIWSKILEVLVDTADLNIKRNRDFTRNMHTPSADGIAEFHNGIFLVEN